MPFKILLVDDHAMIRAGVKAILESHPEFQVIGEAGSGPEAVRICAKERPNLVLMDIEMPGLNGIEATAEIRRHSPDTSVVILSMYDDEHSVMSAIQAGAHGFVLKSSSGDDVLEALHRAVRGGYYLSPQVSHHAVAWLQRDRTLEPEKSPLQTLSPREMQLLRLVAEGNASKEIAAILGLSIETVRSYRKTTMRKLGVNNVAALTRVAYDQGIVRMNAMVSAVNT